LPYFPVTYEQLIGQDYETYFKQILAFLGANPEEFVDIIKNKKQRSLKLNVFSIKDCIANFDELLKQATLNKNYDIIQTLTE